MDHLLSPDVIRAAASSTLGILPLMCLILGIVALAFFRDAPVRARLLVFVLFLVGVSGFGYAALNQHGPTPSSESTRQFVVGRWLVQQPIAGMEGASSADYFEDGSFSGSQEILTSAEGRRVLIVGHSHFTKVSSDDFRLRLNFPDGPQSPATLGI